MTRRVVWPVVASVSGGILTVLVLTGVGGPARSVLALWFLLVCTGMSIVPALGIPAPRIELLIGVTIGLLVDTLIAAALAATGDLTAVNALISLEVVCLLGTQLNVVPGPWRPGWPR